MITPTPQAQAYSRRITKVFMNFLECGAWNKKSKFDVLTKTMGILNHSYSRLVYPHLFGD